MADKIRPAATIEEQRKALREAQDGAQLQAQESAVRLALLDGLATGEAAWADAKNGLVKQVDDLHAQVADCSATLKKALGDESQQLEAARDGYSAKVDDLRAVLHSRQTAAADAQNALDRAQQALKALQDDFTAQYGNVTAAMTTRLGDLTNLVAQLKSAMGGAPCDARTAYVLALDIDTKYTEFSKLAGADLAQAAANRLAAIAAAQGNVRAKNKAKQDADQSVVDAQAKLKKTQDDRYGTILEAAKAIAAPVPAPAAPAPGAGDAAAPPAGASGP